MSIRRSQTADIGRLGAAFEKKYGIKVVPWRAGSEGIVNRTIQEARANRFTVDVIETNGPELESLHRENVLQLVRSPHLADLIAPAVLPHGEWMGTRLNVFVQAYNTRLVKKQDLPKTWEEFANPKWKGKIGSSRGFRLARGSSTTSATRVPVRSQDMVTVTACRFARDTHC